ncbi:MAG: NAD-dependent epimerase/dehydratase family protein [Planctomycetes bacterium]|nr:NAD-dependent epimerase/dehydratase family protein [Planctomycetota bacterium]
MGEGWIIDQNEPVLVTGAAGFVGSRVVDSLLRLGLKEIRCFVRPASEHTLLKAVLNKYPGNHCQIISGNLLSRQDCAGATDGVAVVYHLVAGRGKSFPGCFQGSVVTTRNLLDAVAQRKTIRRFVNVSSFAVYSNFRLRRGSLWDESCPLEDNLEERCDAYVYGKIKQDEIVLSYHEKHGIPFTIVRPGIVFGTGKKAIPGFVGMDTFGIFVHLGGRAQIPLTHVNNCADAIVLAGLVPDVDGEVFNVVDDDLISSRRFLREYKKQVRPFRSVRIPYRLAYYFCYLWERYSTWSGGQLPRVFNRRMCSFAWKGNRYSNRKLKKRLGWQCRVPMKEALADYYKYQRNG